jgi:hypothetical protein
MVEEKSGISFQKGADGKIITFNYEGDELIIEASTKYEGSQNFSLNREEMEKLKEFIKSY